MELDHKQKIYEDLDAARDAQRRMAWTALIGMLFYPFIIIFAGFLGLGSTVTILGSLGNVYFVSVAAVVSTFFGKSAYEHKVDKNNKP